MSSTGVSQKTNIMSDEQLGNIRRNALPWVTEKTRRKIMEFFQAVSFELIADKECWLRGNGKITVRMCIKLEQFEHQGLPQEIKVYSPKNSFFDVEAITAQLADILSGHLQSKRHIAPIHFTGETKKTASSSLRVELV